MEGLRRTRLDTSGDQENATGQSATELLYGHTAEKFTRQQQWQAAVRRDREKDRTRPIALAFQHLLQAAGVSAA